MQTPVTLSDAQKTALFKDILDAMSIAIFVIGAGSQVVFTNRAGETMLQNGNYVRLALGAPNGLQTLTMPSALNDAIDRVFKCGSKAGIGVPLKGANGEQSAGYVFPAPLHGLSPLQSQEYCLVFVAQRDGPHPMVIQILRNMFGLTSSEARVAAFIAKGDGPKTIAQTLGVTINTVRTHLKNAFSKTSAKDQTSLGALVNGLVAPIS